MKGRARELEILASLLARAPRVALVGGGGSGKSMLAAALAHRVADRFGGRLDWFRIGAWDHRTLLEMMALRYGTSRDRASIVTGLRAFLGRAPRLVVLDNHEDDGATAHLLDALARTKASFVVTARRCLLGGVLVYPVVAPLVAAGKDAFPRVAALTRMLRFSPLALDIADAIVATGAVTVTTLEAALVRGGVERVRVVDHEDDLPEVALLVNWAWDRLGAASRRALTVLAFAFGDHVDAEALLALADVRGRDRDACIPSLARWHLVQETLPGRFALHAVVRHAVRKRVARVRRAPAEAPAGTVASARFVGDPRRFFEYYVSLLETDPSRIRTEQTHLFAAMDHAHRTSDLDGMLRVERLLHALDASTVR